MPSLIVKDGMYDLMSKKKKTPFSNQIRQEINNIKGNIKNIDKQIGDRFQFNMTELRQEKDRLEKRLDELHPAWCEAWRLKKRKERLERKLKHSSY